MPRIDDIRPRRGTTAEWAAANPVLDFAELGLDTDTGVLKYGDGTTAWLSLAAVVAGKVTSVNARSGAVTGLQEAVATGVATLSGGTAVVLNAAVTANSRIFLTVQSLGTVVVPTSVAVTARAPGTSFTITSANVIDTSVVAFAIFEP